MFDDNSLNWSVLFNDGEPVSIAALKENEPFKGYVYINEIQSLKKGFGKKHLEMIFSKYGAVWLMANTAAGDSLIEYYVKLGLQEIEIGDSVYGCPAYFFCTDDCDFHKLEDYCDAFYSNEEEGEDGEENYEEESINEARVKKTPNEQIKEYYSQLNDVMKERLQLRCVELLDKWGTEVDSGGEIGTVRTFLGDEQFLSMMKKVVPLKEPTVRDMGANTFVSKFFDLPFDAEAYLGKVAKEQGIPYAQAKQEWERSNLDKTHLGRYAHMIADDAIKGNPPRHEGENIKETAVYTAIYDYAQKLIVGATDVESEVSLHANDVNVGGKFDLMFKKGDVWHLVDWKTNGEDLDDIPNGRFGLEDVTKDLNNNSYNKYALQLNVYEWAAKNSGKIPFDATVNKELHHFQYDEGNNIVNIKVVKIPDMQELVQAMVDRAIEMGVVKRK